MNIGKNILELRRQKNITQDDLAAELGVTAAAVSKWENGYTLPDILMLCALADYFGVTTDELLGRNTEKQYAVIAAETPELGKRMEAIANQHGIITKYMSTDFTEAEVVARQDDTIRYLIAGFYTGWYSSDASVCTLVSVHPTDEEILAGLQLVFEKYLTKDSKQLIINMSD